MNKPTLLTILMLAMMFSSTSFAEWTKVSENVDGDTSYVDFETIKEGGGYVYFWVLQDHLKPSTNGVLSVKLYREVDCDIPRKSRVLSYLFYKESMGKGSQESLTPKEPEWDYPPPGSSIEVILE